MNTMNKQFRKVIWISLLATFPILTGRQRSTKNRIPFILVYTESHPDKSSAMPENSRSNLIRETRLLRNC